MTKTRQEEPAGGDTRGDKGAWGALSEDRAAWLDAQRAEYTRRWRVSVTYTPNGRFLAAVRGACGCGAPFAFDIPGVTRLERQRRMRANGEAGLAGPLEMALHIRCEACGALYPFTWTAP